MEQLEIENAYRDDCGEVTVNISGYRFEAGEKYTILEWGWAVYVAVDEVPEEWLSENGEQLPEEPGWAGLTSGGGMLVTSHPVLVALALRAWWGRNSTSLPKAGAVQVPSWEEAVEEVRNRKILNEFNRQHEGTVPGLSRWER